MSQYDTTFDLKINVGQCDLYFMVQWFCLISWRLFDIWKPYFGIMRQYDLMFDLKINVCHCDLYFMVQWFYLVSWRLLMYEQDYESVWPDIWPHNKCRSFWPIFYGPVILSYILKPIWYMNSILWDYESVWPNVGPKNNCRSVRPIFHGLKIIVGRYDLYFMVQFCLISWRLFAVWTSYFGIMSYEDGLMFEHYTLC